MSLIFGHEKISLNYLIMEQQINFDLNGSGSKSCETDPDPVLLDSKILILLKV